MVEEKKKKLSGSFEWMVKGTFAAPSQGELICDNCS